jgi:amino acid permease
MVTGMLSLLFFAILADYSLVLLVKAKAMANVNSMDDLGEFCYGQVGRTIVKSALLLLLIGAMLAMLIVMGDTIPPIVQYVVTGHDYQATCDEYQCPAPRWWAGTVQCAGEFADPCAAPPMIVSRFIMTIVIMMLIYPLCLLRDLSSLRHTSTAALLSICFVVLCLIIKLAQNPIATDMHVFHFEPTIVLALPIQAMAYLNQYNIFDTVNELRIEHENKIYAIVHTSALGLVFPFYLIAGGAGYLHFGNQMAEFDNILKGFPSTDVLMVACSAAIGFTNALKFPLCALPFRNICNEMVGLRRRSEGVQIDPTTCQVAIQMAVLLLILLGMSMVLQNIALALQLVGATAGVMIVFVFPGVFYRKTLLLIHPETTWCATLFPNLLTATGVVVFALTMIGLLYF